jgi:adenosylcobinamide-phosphate synthase
MTETGILISAYLMDMLIGDPHWLPHPVKWIGKVITIIERFLEKLKAKGKGCKERMAGIVLVILVVGGTYWVFYFINTLVLNSHFPLLTSYFLLLLLIYLTSTTLATHELIKSAQAIIDAISIDNIEEARKRLSLIVSRDTEALDKCNILKATIETTAENASDGIIAPLFYFVIGGLPLAMTYKAVNTLDSMVGYKNERYKNFGWAAARLDDIANYIPARITGILIVIATFILNIIVRSSRWFNIVQNSSKLNYIGPLNNFELYHHVSGINALRIMLTDGRKHPSPNSGVPEAAMAGALGVRLGGPSLYGGVVVKKPYIGEDLSNSSRWFKMVQDSSNLNNIGQSLIRLTDSYEQYYLQASEKALLITKVTSILGFSLAVSLIYISGH